jgi:PLP dependent protein
MAVNKEMYKTIINELGAGITLVAVSKTKPVEDIRELYDLGQRDFGENYVQELMDKEAALPKDIRWHFIGHLQSNKAKYIVPFVHLIHGVDSVTLLQEINKQSKKINRITPVLLQVHIAREETKFGLDETELEAILNTRSDTPSDRLPNIKISGLMGMASFTDELNKVRTEFKYLKSLFDKFNTPLSPLSSLSMGMSSDYKIALEEGSNMVRMGSLLLGARNYS